MRLARFALAFGVASCAQVLGGLDEGTPASPSGDPDCGGWLEGFAHRVAFDVENAEIAPLAGYSLPLSLSTKDLVASHAIRADGADLRVTRADGVSILPHWLESGLGREATRLWTKADLAPGTSRLYLYYGNPAAEERGNLRDVFVDGIVTNGDFSQGIVPWYRTTPPQEMSVGFQAIAGQAQVSLFRGPSATPGSAAICQNVLVPADRSYSLVLDVEITDSQRGTLSVWAGGVDGTSLLGVDGLGERRDVETARLPPGLTAICLGGTLAPFGSEATVRGSFSNVRVRVSATPTPVAGAAGPVESPSACPR